MCGNHVRHQTWLRNKLDPHPASCRAALCRRFAGLVTSYSHVTLSCAIPGLRIVSRSGGLLFHSLCDVRFASCPRHAAVAGIVILVILIIKPLTY